MLNGFGIAPNLPLKKQLERVIIATALSVALSASIVASSFAALPSSIQPYAFSGKSDELGFRKPLVLVHGIAPDQGEYYNWGLFLESLKDNAAFYERYKIYFFVYQPNAPLKETAEQFKTAIKAMHAEFPDKPIKVLALSLGGLVTKEAIADPEVNNSIEQVITIGTPFHGTPLANANWIRAELKQEPVLSPLRLTNRMAFGMTKKKFPNFAKDFCWDNFDQSMPRDLKSDNPCLNSSKQTVVKESTEPVIQAANYQPEQVADSLPESNLAFSKSIPDAANPEAMPADNVRQKFITYSSFFGAESVTTNRLSRALQLPDDLSDRLLDIPETATGGGPLDKHNMMAMVQESLAKLPLAGSTDSNGGFQTVGFSAHPKIGNLKSPSEIETSQTLMALNDGVSPVTSHLWMGKLIAEVSDPASAQEAMWMALKMLKNSKQARLFPNMDHRDWMEGSTRTGRTTVPDLLHPEERPKTVFDWITNDLMQ